ncbi:putative bifunctional diguanylate cyclase/phosphodiesterase [Paraburkholderia aromaticivorans]|uniref:Bifunctional diguanylate cyclase/phosphodiesterase n=1 Tax=Paraburkholderia aromaticivorans TaxID=2026199 RepID=A0A248VUX0_9BURK|nr:EAL domain-containing protein [Paraburkholderia aromaticivorans]ASW02826.1 bifunctional diguanylate cyclase/phosphodiesterase [Paraburkholderia aromaticivorans]
MQSSYNLWLVAISFVVATLASYTALDLTGRIFLLASPRARQAWRLGGAAALGVGIWSMHFIAMLAFSLPIPLGYDFPTTAASLGLATAASYLALTITTHERLTAGRLPAAGVVMGCGIAGMHYVGMAAMQMTPGIVYRPAWFAGSLAVAIGASSAALWLARALSDDDARHVVRKRLAAALVMGVAISGMHYAGMAAAEFAPGAVCGAANGVNTTWLATSVTLFTFAILIVTLMLSRFDARTTFLVGAVSRLNGQIVRLATLDSLTGLPNRSTLTERIEHAIHRAQRQRSLCAVLFMDLDGFKTINDSLGHSVGDQVLTAFAQRLLLCVRASDTVARLGGDEFVVLAENFGSREDAGALAEGVLDRMRMGMWTDSQPLQVMPSIGIALYPDDGDSVETLLKHADAAMYEAKRAGRSTYRFFERSMNEAAMRTLQIQSALHDALAAGHFSLHFQPKFHGGGESLAGAEALIRLHHPQLGEITPLEFIPIAERSGQILHIGYWVVREACRQIRRWIEHGLPSMKVAINLSPRQMLQPNLVASMLEIVEAEGVECTQIMFEITETVAMQDAPRTIEMIRQFQACGFEIAIDDFGTGYSSLAYLQRFRVKQLKIDRFFTNGLDAHGLEGRAIVSAIIALAHSLEMDVVAEGVETESQLNMLRSMMCDEMQGFLLGKPLNADDFGSLLRETRVSA